MNLFFCWIRVYFDLDLNGDGFVDENEFNEVIAKKSDSLNQRRINFFRKILTKENGGQVSYQGNIYPCFMNK